MESINDKEVLVSGASIAGLATAYWLNRIGYKVTVVEQASAPRTAGAAFDIKVGAVDVVRRMGIFDELMASRLIVNRIEFKNAADITEGSINLRTSGGEPATEEIEIEREKFTGIMLRALRQNVDFIFNDRITALTESEDDIEVVFRNAESRRFHLVVGCDGTHSGVRKIWFGEESDYSRFMSAYFAIGITDKLLVTQKTLQMFNVPGKAIMLNAYNRKTDIIFCFAADEEFVYDYRQPVQQKEIISRQFSKEGWRTAELLDELMAADNFYFDKFCQIKMPSWSKGRVVLVGDAGYCASPAAGMGGSLAVSGAAALADALLKHDGDFAPAFREYETVLRPLIQEVQGTAEYNLRENFIPGTEEAIHLRNTQSMAF